MAKTQVLFQRRKQRTHIQIRRRLSDRCRLTVFRSGKHMYAQVIDDRRGVTVAAASTVDQELRSKLRTGANTEAATAVGKLIAERALAAGLKDVAFDRGGYHYHGRVKALAEAAREGGLSF